MDGDAALQANTRKSYTMQSQDELTGHQHYRT